MKKIMFAISLIEVEWVDKKSFVKKTFPLFKEAIPFYC